MKKRRKIVLVVSPLLVVGSIFVWNFWLANFPSVQAWIHDWLENPIGLTAIATLGAAVGTVGAVIIALYGTRHEQRKAQEDREESRRQFLASQKQTQDALEEGRRQFLEAQYATNKPILVPEYCESQYTNTSIRNDGTGIAINIIVLRYPAKFRDELPTICYMLSPIPKNEFKELMSYLFNDLKGSLTPHDKIGTYTLGVPEGLASEGHVARFVLTYLDIFGRKHASIFDQVAPLDVFGRRQLDSKSLLTWQCIGFLSDIAQDINEMIDMWESSSTKDTKL